MVLVEAGSTAASTVRASAGYSEDATIVASAGLLSRTGHIFRESLKMSRELSDHFPGMEQPHLLHLPIHLVCFRRDE